MAKRIDRDRSEITKITIKIKNTLINFARYFGFRNKPSSEGLENKNKLFLLEICIVIDTFFFS